MRVPESDIGLTIIDQESRPGSPSSCCLKDAEDRILDALSAEKSPVVSIQCATLSFELA